MMYDSFWKKLVGEYFCNFMELYFPSAYSEIDWERGHEFLDKELGKIQRENDTGTKFVDKLVKC